MNTEMAIKNLREALRYLDMCEVYDDPLFESIKFKILQAMEEMQTDDRGKCVRCIVDGQKEE